MVDIESVGAYVAAWPKNNEQIAENIDGTLGPHFDNIFSRPVQLSLDDVLDELHQKAPTYDRKRVCCWLVEKIVCSEKIQLLAPK